MLSKAACERIHAKRRAFQRYALVLTRDNLRQIANQIRGNKAEYVGRQSCRLTVWVIEWTGVKATVVYDSRRGEIVTFLPVGAEIIAREECSA